MEIEEELDGHEQNHDPEAPPPSSSSLLGIPTVIFASGGAWLIGYKMWGCLLARPLTARGVMVILPDYRNFPWRTIPDMVDDMDQVIDWTLRHITACGGDASKVVLVGQSAGGHLGLVSLLRRTLGQLPVESTPQANQATTTRARTLTSISTSTTSWKPTDLNGFLSLSAPVYLAATEPTFRKHGLHSSVVDRMFGHEKEAYDAWSIVNRLSDQEATYLAENLPPMRLYHGSADRTVPCDGAAECASALQGRVRSDISWTVYEGWSHTDAILEGPMQGNNSFHHDVVQAIADWTGLPDDQVVVEVHERPLCPRMLVRCAKLLMPF